MAKLLLRCLFYLQFHNVMRYLSRKKATILTYHSFTDKKNHPGIENYKPTHLNVQAFRAQIAYLKKYYHIISLDQLVEHIINGASIPYNSVVITIDDGYQSNHKLAYPVLKKFRAPATIFLATNFVDKKDFLWVDRLLYALDKTKAKSLKIKINNEMLSFSLNDNASKMACDRKIRAKLKAMPQESVHKTIESIEASLGQKLSMGEDTPETYLPLEWPEILEMVQSGVVSIGSHTCNHVIVSRCNIEEMKKELLLSKQLIEERTGLSCRLFSYPNGNIGDFNHHTKTLLRKLGYSCGLITVTGMNQEESDIFELKRFDIATEDSIRFVMVVSGVVKLIGDVKSSVTDAKKLASSFVYDLRRKTNITDPEKNICILYLILSQMQEIADLQQVIDLPWV
ncbi:MAG: polysaccharide deacetylase family protein [Anaerolineae bacterium]|nr:polysaccharide deacetylase family protein [Anaerolineae bacterium]